MSETFKATQKKPKRDFGDWLFDNFGWIMLAAFIICIAGTGTFVYLLSAHLNEIARAAGGVARSAADGFSHK